MNTASDQPIYVPLIEPGHTYEFVMETSRKDIDVNFLVKKSQQDKPDGVLVHFAPPKHESVFQDSIYFGHRDPFLNIDHFDIIFVSDPALKLEKARRYSLAIIPESDGIALIAEALDRLLKLLGHTNKNIRFYGYDQGGFLALQTATFFEQSLVFAQSPITEALNIHAFWEDDIVSSVLSITAKEFATKYPAQNDVWKRMQEQQHIPQTTIFTNKQDYFSKRLFELFRKITDVDDNTFVEIGDCTLILSDQVQGHRPLPQYLLRTHLQDFLNDPPVFFEH